jgi:long-chain acyl-CoA synthetase
MNDLYRAWEKVRDHNRGVVALTDAATGRQWDFHALQVGVDALSEWRNAGEPICPSGFSTDIVFETLRAWRDDAVLCPVERDTDRPGLETLADQPREVCHLKLTSGSSSGPKIVAFRADQLAADARKIVSTMGLRPDWPNLGVISMSHSYGFSNLVLPLLLHGIPLVWLGDPLPAAVSRWLTAPSAHWTLPAVPAMWRVWHESGILSRQTSIRIALSAGAPLPDDLARAVLADSGLTIHNFYGSSECGGIAWDGQPMDETTFHIDAAGCLEVSGPSVGLGYWPGPAFEPSRFVTGDLAEIDTTTGRVRLLGRRDDVINVAGRKVSPSTVEKAIASLPGIRHVLVFGIPSADPIRGEEIVAVINGEDPRTNSLASLLPHERPRHWWICDDLLPDGRGKLSRDTWRQRFLDQTLSDRRDNRV